MLKFIETNRDAALAAGLVVAGAGFTAAAAALLVDSREAFKVSVLLPAGAALSRASAVVGRGGTRALVPACVRVGRPVGSALRKAGGLIGLHASAPRRQFSPRQSGLG